MTISGKNTDIIQKLKAHFQNLNWFTKLFFPRIAAEILDQLPTNSTIPIHLESARVIFSALAKSFSFQLWAWLWLPKSEFQHLKTISDLIIKEQLSDINDTHIINKMNLLLVCQSPDVSLKIYAILHSVDLITPSNLDLISSYADLAQLLMILERLQQFHMLTQNNIDTFTDKQSFYRMKDIKLLEDAKIDNTVYREAILLCDSGYSTYLASALTFLHQAKKLPLGDNADDCFVTLVLFKDIIRYLRELDVIQLTERGGYAFSSRTGPFFLGTLSAHAPRPNPELAPSIFKNILCVTYPTQN